MSHSKASHVVSAIAGVLIVGQFVLIFFFSIPGTLGLRILGYGLWGLCIIFGWLPIFTLKKYGGVPKGKSYMRTEKLVTKGIFSVVRHPQYLCMPLMPVALALLSQHWIVIALGIPAFSLGIISIIGADKEGIEKFGAEYREYMKKVPGFNILLGLGRRIFTTFRAGHSRMK
jgi:protein-S-isoprenylcysteine O-methyltransferase Ste14